MTTNPASDNFVDRNEILPLLGPVKKQGDWLMAKCPVHEDEHPSLGLSSAGVLRCFTGCEFKDVIAALRGPSPVQPIRKPSPERQVALYEYKDASGVVVAEKARFENAEGRKSFKWRLPGATGWPSPSGVVLANLPLYGLPQLKEHPSDPVYFVEGEKACEACWEHGLMAVTHGGGASTKDFGDSLEVLRSRTVHLWPDNDAPGAAYMGLLRAKLTVLGCDVRVVAVQLPPKGDAWDFFAAGHTVEEIDTAAPAEPVVSVLAEDTIRVSIPTESGAVTLTFSQMEKRARQFDAELTVSCFTDPEPYTQSVNLNSNSGVTELRRNLDEVFGKTFAWTRLLNKAVGLARDAYLNQDRGLDLSEIPDVIGEVLLVPPLVVADGATIFFGDGSSLKSYVSAEIAYCMAKGETFCGMSTPRLTPLIIDYEDSGPNYRRRVKRLCKARDHEDVSGIRYWEAKGIPLTDLVDPIKRYIERHGVGILIVDSVAAACGGDPLDPKAVLTFFSALKKLGLPSILIAHVTKAMDTMKPFGTVYWHNEARRTWFVQRVQEEESDEVDLGFYNRKVNDGRKPAPIAFHASFSEDEHGPVYLSLGSMERAPAELIALTSARNQVWQALSGLPRTVKNLMEETGLSRSAIEAELKAGPFVIAGVEPTTIKGGKPAHLWARQEVLRSNQQNPQQNPQNTLGDPKPQVLLDSFALRETQNYKTPNESETACWRCGAIATSFDSQMRPTCRDHRDV